MARKNPRKFDRYHRPLTAEYDLRSPLATLLSSLAEGQEKYENNVENHIKLLRGTVSDLENRVSRLENIITFERLRRERLEAGREISDDYFATARLRKGK